MRLLPLVLFETKQMDRDVVNILCSSAAAWPTPLSSQL
jgi:hypothetical protein